MRNDLCGRGAAARKEPRAVAAAAALLLLLQGLKGGGSDTGQPARQAAQLRKHFSGPSPSNQKGSHRRSRGPKHVGRLDSLALGC